jgi:hypothetical protein
MFWHMSSAAQRLRFALEMFDVGLEMYRKKIERTQPQLTSAQVDLLVQQWLLVRPGAEHGDSAGVPFTFPKDQ